MLEGRLLLLLVLALLCCYGRRSSCTCCCCSAVGVLLVLLAGAADSGGGAAAAAPAFCAEQTRFGARWQIRHAYPGTDCKGRACIWQCGRVQSKGSNQQSRLHVSAGVHAQDDSLCIRRAGRAVGLEGCNPYRMLCLIDNRHFVLELLVHLSCAGGSFW